MNFKKRVNGSWADTPHYIHNTSTDTLTTLPAVVYPNATTATVGLKGQATQSGTPTPDSPIMPQGTGERTENLFDVLDYTNISTSTNGGASNVAKTTSTISFKSDGENDYSGIYISATYFTAHINDYDVSTTYTLSADVYTDVPCTIIFGGSTTIVSIPAGTSRLSYRFYGNITLAFYIRNTTANITLSKIMCAINDTIYEPYGYKIPISSANTTTPVYLGEVETTRKIKKLVLTGKESWYISTTWERASTSVFYSASSDIINIQESTEIFILSDRFEAASRDELYNEDSDMIARTGTNSITIRVSDSIATTVADFKTYLATQYTNGTPVTVWYVLATETTGIVNEPLRKIGDYADTVSGITIPTITGKDTVDVETTLKPSEVELTYTGWHDATVKEWDGSDWQ